MTGGIFALTEPVALLYLTKKCGKTLKDKNNQLPPVDTIDLVIQGAYILWHQRKETSQSPGFSKLVVKNHLL